MLVEQLKAQHAVKEYLLGRGFKQLNMCDCEDPPSTLQFTGELSEKCEKENITIKIKDWDFIEFPKIYLQPNSNFIVNPTAHIGIDRAICYAVEGSVILNALYPINAVAFCIDIVEKLLIELKEDKEKEKEDFEREFFSIWGQALGISIDFVYSSPFVELLYSKKDDELRFFIQNKNSTFDTPHSFGFEVTNRFNGGCIKIPENFCVRSYNPPQTLGEMIRFARQLGSKFCHQLYEIFDAIFSSPNPSKVYFIVIDAKNGLFGFSFVLDNTQRQNPKDAKNIIAGMKAMNHPTSKTNITRFNTLNYKVEDIFSRNGQLSLEGKRILLVGGGAIGGYLADVLSRLGGGYKGELCIADKEHLYPENIGRHRLGMDNILINKASALEKRLLQEFPYSKITSINEDILKSISFDWDLIIDATGDERTSRTINRLHQKSLSKGRNTCPVLYCWIAGQGEAWQTLWVEGKQENACWECLFIHANDGGRTLRYPTIIEPRIHLEIGCKAITPYASTAAMSIAALAGEVVIDWLNGNSSPNFRTRGRTSANIAPIQDSDLCAQTDCPVCQIK